MRCIADSTDTIISIQAINFMGPGERSEAFYFVSGPLSRPGPPRLPSTYSATGGATSLALQPPLDTGKSAVT